MEGGAPWRADDWRERAFGPRPAFTPFTTATFHHDHACTAAGVVDRFRGVSHIAALAPARQAEVLGEVRDLLRTHPDTRGRAELRIPYRVDAAWCERRAGAGPG